MLPSIKELETNIEKIINENNISYIDAIIDYCDKNKIEIEAIGEIISNRPNWKSKVEAEAESLNFIKKFDKLPL